MQKTLNLGPCAAELNEESPTLSLRELLKVHGRSQPVVQKEKHMSEITVSLFPSPWWLPCTTLTVCQFQPQLFPPLLHLIKKADHVLYWISYCIPLQ